MRFHARNRFRKEVISSEEEGQGKVELEKLRAKQAGGKTRLSSDGNRSTHGSDNQQPEMIYLG